MGTTLHNFIDIFNSNFEVSGESIQLNKIVIPIIQRDYAQGRTSYTVNRVRERFLNALKDAICNEPVTLDFVYGDIDENGQMIVGDMPQPPTPSDPTEPPEPTEPSEPSDPTEPSEPSEPSDPTEPSDPGTATEEGTE